MSDEKLRWLYRFDNYQGAFLLLREVIETMQSRKLTQLEKEGVIQRFEYTWELAWKVMKDYLTHNGIELTTLTPASVFRAAFAAQIIDDGEGWMDTIEARNLMSHTYDVAKFQEITTNIKEKFFPLFENLYTTLKTKADA